MREKNDNHITIVLPLPNKTLNPNRSIGRHWAVRQKAKSEAFNTAAWLTFQELKRRNMEPPKWKKVAALFRFMWPDKKRRDHDNALASCKAYIDGITKAGIMFDDSAIISTTIEFGIDRTSPRLVVKIEEVN